MNDLKFALRQVLKSPGLTLLAMLTLGLGIGASSAVFSLIQGVLLTAPPYARPDQLVLIHPARKDGQPYTRGWPATQWQDWQASSQSFAAIAAYAWTFNYLVLPDGSESVEGMAVTPAYFRALGLNAALGRTFLESDLATRPAPFVILGHDLWQRRFASDPGIVGRTVQISRMRQPLTVVGVMPPDIRFLPAPDNAQEPNYNVDAKVDYWLAASPSPRNLNSPDWQVVGRLRDGVSAGAAQAELAGLTAREAQDHREFEGISAKAELLTAEMNREGRRLLYPVAGAVALVFLIGCGNAAGLLLARGLQRQHEYAVRAAMGAGSLQLCRPVLIESLLLALGGGAVGMVLAIGCVTTLKSLGGAGIPRLDAVTLGWPLLAFSLGAAAVAGIMAGLLPAWRALGREAAAGLRSGTRTASVGRPERRWLSGVAALQIGLTLALLVGAGLLIQTVHSLTQLRPGYDVRNILTLSVTAVGSNSLTFHKQALERVAQLPGIKSAAFAWGVPLTGNKWTGAFDIVGVLADSRTDSLTEAAEPELYFSFWQQTAFSKHLVLRTVADPKSMVTATRRELRAIDPTVSVEHFRTLEEIRADSMAPRTFTMKLLVTFALVACLLATVGIYGVLSLTVGSRRSEIAIRMAVGAQRADVLRLIFRDGIRLAATGVAIGLVVALILAACLKTFLFGIAPTDPLTLAAMILLVMALTLITCWIPARRATGVDPLLALRSE